MTEITIKKKLKIKSPIDSQSCDNSKTLDTIETKDDSKEEDSLHTFRLPKPNQEESASFTLDEKKTDINDISTDITIKKKLKPRVIIKEEIFDISDDNKPKIERKDEENLGFVTFPSEDSDNESQIMNLRQRVDIVEESADICLDKNSDIDYKDESNVVSITFPTDDSDIETQTFKLRKDRKVINEEEDQVFNIALKRGPKIEETSELFESEFSIKRITESKVKDFYSETEKSFQLFLNQKKKTEKIKFEEELDESETELTLKRERDIKELSVTTIRKDIQVQELIATMTMVSQTPELLSVSEGDRLYVVERHTSDWWFVRKRLTNESGYIQSRNVVDTDTYTNILKDKVVQKIEKLPIYQIEEPDDTFAPRFVKRFQSISASIGERVVFECQVEGNPRPTITWFKHSAILKENNEIKMFYEENNIAKLVIIEVFAEDAAKYTVVAKNSVGYVSHTVDLNVDVEDILDIESVATSRKSMSRESSLANIIEGIPPVFAEPPTSVEIKRGHPFTLEVCVSTQTKPKIKWFRNGKEIKETKRIKMTSIEDIYHFKYQLHFEKSVDDEGVYEIFAENNDGNASTNIVVYFEDNKQKPQFIQKFDDLIVEEESDVTLAVKYTANPRPDIYWFRNDKTIKSQTISFKQKDYTNESRITLEKVIKDKHSGVYKCVAINAVGKCEHLAQLRVITKGLRFIERLQELEVQENSQTLLVVKISSEEEDVKWAKDGQQIDSNDLNYEFIKEGFYRKLLVKNTRIDSEGEYTCVLGTDNECSADLIVIELPPKILTKLEDKICVLGQTVSFNIEVSKGDAIVEWFKDNYEIKFNDRIKLTINGKQQELMIINITEDDEGVYSCKLGQQKYSAKLKVELKSVEFIQQDEESVSMDDNIVEPSPPMGPLMTSDNTDNSFTLNWNPPKSDGNSTIIEYIIERKESTKKIWQKCGSVDGNTLSLNVTNLKKEMAYHFRITCRNKVGISLPLATEETITPRSRFGAPSMPGRPLQVIEMTNTSLTLSWTKPLSTGGVELTSYILERRLISESNWIRVDTIDPQITNCTIKNLSAKHQYFFRVIAENPLGLSPPLETETALKLSLTADNPGIPTGPLETRIVGPSAIVVEWGKPDTDGGAPILSYVVVARDVRRTMWMEVGHVEADTHRLQIKDLQEGHQYLVRIMARNEVGLSEPLEMFEPLKLVRPPGTTEWEQEVEVERADTPSLSFTTTETSSWMREAGVEANITSYTRHRLLHRREYFFKLWVNADKLFK
ncbi:titin-like isoform X2 [Oppia nitens]|uniref:titin-like isoform X2 n=1 Tax=Oppia nitens TaxID=1686743 RepID=UPI0023DBE7D9|nr:titin-like isoform X2 [Oppia nitens]